MPIPTDATERTVTVPSGGDEYDAQQAVTTVERPRVEDPGPISTESLRPAEHPQTNQSADQRAPKRVTEALNIRNYSAIRRSGARPR